MKQQTLLALLSATLAVTGAQTHAATPDGANTPAKMDINTCTKPEWPKEALRNEQTGRVTLAFRIDADGTVLESQVKQSSGFPLLDEAARSGLMTCRFQPAVVNGRAEPSWMRVQYVWTLEDAITDAASLQAFALMRERAEQGDAEAQRQLGKMYLNGKGVARDVAQALAWFEKAGAAGDAEGQFRAGTLLLGGFGVPRDPEQAAAWYAKAAQQGHAGAQTMLGNMYMSGRGVARDDAQAVDWLRKAVEQEHGPACALLAQMTRDGRGGIVADRNAALRLLRKGAALDDRQAQYHLGAELVTMGTAPEQAEGVTWLLKAAALGLPEIQSMLGLAYRDGIGVQRDYVQARAWLGKAASQSWPKAQYALAVLTEQGLGGKRNDAEALALYQKAAARGIPEAALRLADASAQGELGNPVDPAKAEEWRQKAAGMERHVH